MKNITKQYQDLLEGKMSKANFMVNVRRDFPQWISPVNSFDDAVNILKSKRILTEASAGNHSGRIGGESRKTENVADPEGYDDGDSAMFGTKPITSPTIILHALMDQGKSATEAAIETIKKFPDVHIDVILDSINDYEGVKKQRADWNLKNPHYADLPFNESADMDGEEWTEERLLDAMAKMLQINQDAEIPGDKWDAIVDKIKSTQGSLNEAVEKPAGAYKNVTGKAEYDKFAEMDRVDYRQLMKGTEFELLKMPEITDENLVKAKTKAYRALIKNPKAYMHLVTANANEVEKKDKDLRMQPVKGDNKVDKANAMKVIKKDEGSNTQTNLSNKEKAKGNPKGVKEMPDKGVIGTEKVLRESLVRQLRENILDEMTELGSTKKNFSKGQKVKTREGLVGTVLEETPDSTVVIELDNGKQIHKQANVLEAYQEEARDWSSSTEFGATEMEPSPSYQMFGSDKRGQDINAAAAAETHNGYKRGDKVKIDRTVVKDKYGINEPETQFIITSFKTTNPGKALQNVQVTLKDLETGAVVDNVYIGDLEAKDKSATLKEKLVKSLKKEAGILQTSTGVTLASGTNDQELKKTGKALKTNMKKPIIFVNPDTGAKQPV